MDTGHGVTCIFRAVDGCAAPCLGRCATPFSIHTILPSQLPVPFTFRMPVDYATDGRYRTTLFLQPAPQFCYRQHTPGSNRF